MNTIEIVDIKDDNLPMRAKRSISQGVDLKGFYLLL